MPMKGCMSRTRTGMTSISATQPTALLILQQTNAQLAAAKEGEEEGEKKPDLIATANGISGEPAEETVKAAFAVSLAFMEVDEKSKLAEDAAAFIDSDQFLVSDPSIKQTLKALIAEKGWEFMMLVKQQQENHRGLGREDLYALVLPQMIASNRERFDDDEMTLAFKFEDRPGLIIFIPDSEGNSTYREFIQAIKEEENAAHRMGDDTALKEVRAAFEDYISRWTKAFRFDFPEPPMVLDAEDVRYGLWMKKSKTEKPEPGAAS